MKILHPEDHVIAAPARSMPTAGRNTAMQHVARSNEIPEPSQAHCSVGKSLLMFRNRVKSREQKYFASHFGKSEIELRRLIPEEGRRPSSLNVGMGCGGRFCSGARERADG